MRLNQVMVDDFERVFKNKGYYSEVSGLEACGCQEFIKNWISNSINKDNFALPEINLFMSSNPDAEKALVAFYDDYFKSILTKPSEHKMIAEVENRVKAVQAYGMFGLLYGLNLNKDSGEMEIYYAPKTIDPKSKYGFKVDLGAKENTAVKKNKEGVLCLYRWDIPDELESMATEGEIKKPSGANALELLGVGDGKVAFAPFTMIQYLKEFFYSVLPERTVKITTKSMKGAYGSHYVSANKEALLEYGEEGYSDSLQMVKNNIRPFIYSPVLGADSTSLGLTRIDFIELTSVNVLEKGEKPGLDLVKSKGVDISNYLKHQITISTLGVMRSTDITKYSKVVKSFPHSGAYFDGDEPLISDMSSYLRSLSEGDIDRIYNSVPNIERRFNSASKYIKGFKLVPSEGMTDVELDSLLKEGVCRVVTETKGSRFLNMLVTKNRTILQELYGPNYIDKFESETYKLGLLHKALKEKAQDFKTVTELDRFVNSFDNIASIVEAYNVISSISRAYFKDDIEMVTISGSKSTLNEEQTITGISEVIEKNLGYKSLYCKKIAEIIFDAGGFYQAILSALTDFDALYLLFYGKPSSYKSTSGTSDGIVYARDCFGISDDIIRPIKMSLVKQVFKAVV